MSDSVGMHSPQAATLVRLDPLPVGGGGIGCSSNGRVVACTYRGDPALQSNLVVYDADGNRLWEDRGQLGTTAGFSAPIVGSDNTVIAADRAWVFCANPLTGTHPTTASDSLIRLDADTGATDQQVVVSRALGIAPGYVAQSVVSVSSSPSGAVVLTIGAQLLGTPGQPSYVAAIDVSTTAAGSALWRYTVAADAATNAAAGQFPIVANAVGARRTVFNGSRSSTFFVGEP